MGWNVLETEVAIKGYGSIKVSFIGRGPVQITTVIKVIMKRPFGKGWKTTLAITADENVFMREWY
jgi:hypothetical protein